MAKKVQIDIKINTAAGVKNVGDLDKAAAKSVKTIHTLQDELNDLERYIKDVDVGSDAFKDMAERAKELSAELKDVNLEMKGLTSDDMAKAFASTVSGFASITSGALAMADSLGLVDKKNDEMTKTLVAGIAVANSFSLGMNGIIKAQLLLKNSTVASTIATKGGTVAMKVYNAVVAANPIGLLVIALLSAVAAFALFNSGSKDGAKSTEELDRENVKLNKTLQEQNKLIDKNNELKNIQRDIRDSRRILLIQRDILFAENELLKLRRDTPDNIDAITKAQRRLNELNINLAKEQHTTTLKNLADENLLHNERMNNAIENRRNFKKGTEEYKYWNDEFIKYADLQDTYLDRRGELELRQENELIKLRIDNANKLASIKKPTVDTTEEIQEEEKLNDLKFLLAEKAYNDLILLKINHERDLALIDAEQISNERVRDETILGIKNGYFNKLTDAIRASANKQIEILNEQERIELENAKDNIDERLRIEREFALAREQINSDTEIKIRSMSNETVDTISDNMTEKIAQWSADNAELISFVQESATKSIGLISDFMNQKNEEEAENRANLYDKDVELLKASLANREISQKEFDNKMAILDNKKKQQDLESKRKAFNQSKGIQITNAVMQTANAVLSAFSSAAAIPIAGVALGPIMAGVAGALGAAQIAVISSQKFKAARGGIVPGNGPSHIDSVDALLAPGEAVINSKSTSMFPGLLSEINKAGGGVSLAPDTFNQGNNENTESVFSENNNKTIKAFVVESEITEKQRRISRIERSASFG